MPDLTRALTLAALSFAPLSAFAGTTLTASGAAGVFAAQPGAGAELSADVLFPFPLAVQAELALVGRAPVLRTAADDFFPVVGLPSLAVSAPFRVGPRSRLGPELSADALAISAVEQDCGGGSGCRYYNYTEIGGLGLAFTPALGAAWSHVGATGAPDGQQASLALQPTMLYDVVIPIAPRVNVAWITGSGVRVSAEANRYGASLEVGSVL